ncbi:MAG: aminoacyl-tRNA hydrolase [Lachnospiraceae bacterium]|nr:aminoacyl-tRNA hydrolase [Lachnospiraceae bacterium]
MFMIVGLGNPGKKYEGTRHNTGYMALDALASRAQIRVETVKFHGLIGTGFLEGEKVVLVKPTTYMNLSGDCVRPAADYYQIEPENIVVLCDDVWLPAGQLRIRKKGSAGGHNGLKSIIGRLGTQEFPRIRIGVGGAAEHVEMVSHVLGHFAAEERRRMADAAEEAARAVEEILRNGIDSAMNLYNRKPEAEGPQN